jgi:D-alanyl-D-alanine carboxypeptidase
VPFLQKPFFVLAAAGATLAGAVAGSAPARAEALLLIEADTGKVIHGENATYPWYPASVTKLMTTYVTLKALRDRRITLDTLFTVSGNAVAQQPSKMGFKAGTQVTVDNALKMLLVHSANDMAVVLAEGVSGSIEKFADEMNASARRLGMTQTTYVNPNGLPADEQITSARDLAILARALIREFPEYDSYWHIGAIKLGKRIYRNTNKLIDAYPGADGMKTGFICASGFNLVASATRGNKRLIAVVLGAPSSAARAAKAAQLLESGFTTNPLSWLMPSQGTVDSLVPLAVAPPNLREDICGKNRHRPSEEDEEAAGGAAAGDSGVQSFLLSALRSTPPPASALLTSGLAAEPPVEVYVGPARHPGAPGEATAAAPAVRKKPEGTAIAATPPAAKKSEGATTKKPEGTAIAVTPPATAARKSERPAAKKPEGTAIPATPSTAAAKNSEGAPGKKPDGTAVAAKPSSQKPPAKPASDAAGGGTGAAQHPATPTGSRPWPLDDPAAQKPKPTVAAAKPKPQAAPKADPQ